MDDAVSGLNTLLQFVCCDCGIMAFLLRCGLFMRADSVFALLSHGLHHSHAQLAQWWVASVPDALDATREALSDPASAARDASRTVKDTVVDKANEYKGVYDSINSIIKAFWERVPYLVIAIGVFAIFWLLSRLFKKIIRQTLGQRARKQNLVLAMNRLGSTLIVFLGFMIAMVVAIPGFTPGQLLSTLGLGSLAIGFAFKDIVQNLLSGMIILISEPFRIGDQIITDKHEGIVEDIQIRATYLRTYDGRRVVIPNAQLYTNTVTVNTAYKNRRVQVNVGVGCNDDLDQAKQAILDALHRCSSVAQDQPITIVLTELGDFANNLMVRWWIQTSSQVDVTSSTDEVLTAIQHALTQAGIDLPYPTSQVLFHNQNGELPGDRGPLAVVQPASPIAAQPSTATAALSTAAASTVICNRDPSEDSQPENDKK